MKVSTQFWMFFVGLAAPTALSFTLGGLRLTIYRLALIFFILFSISSYKKYCKPTFTNPTFLLFCYALLAMLSLTINHGFLATFDTSGVYFLEIIGPFLLSLTYCTTVKRLKTVITAYLIAVNLTLLVTLPETLSGFNWVYKLLENTQPKEMGARLGLNRSYGTFDHPILQGVFASTAISLAWFMKRYFYFIGTLLATVTSVSSGAILSVFIQFILIGWERITRTMRNRWLILAILIVAGYIFIDLLSNRSALKAILSQLTLSSQTAYWRMLIWEYGMQNVWQNPFFGIGLSEWQRPAWMHSASIDAFWLVSMMRYGLPAFLCYASAFIIIIYKLFSFKTYHRELLQIRRGWLVGMVGLIISTCTVHLWNNSFVFINFYLGIGTAILVVLHKQKNSSNTLERISQTETTGLRTLFKNHTRR